jgi:glutamine amidotransferase
MCRLLAARDRATPFAIAPELQALAEVARRSKEYQGDGWGCAWWEGGAWQVYRAVTPIWEDDLGRFGEARVLLAHARSAFRNEGVRVEHNMPFVDGAAGFVFNGELRGVRLAARGRIGAEKLFDVLRRLGADGGGTSLARCVEIVARHTRYVRAMNFVLANGPVFRVCSRFSEDPDYFTMHLSRRGERLRIASEPYPGEHDWTPIPNGSLLELA